MKDIEKIAMQAGVIALGVILGGWVMAQFKDVAIIKEAQSGFNS